MSVVKPTLFLTLFLFANFNVQWHLYPRDGGTEIYGYGFPFVWFGRSIIGSGNPLSRDLTALLIDFAFYLLISLLFVKVIERLKIKFANFDLAINIFGVISALMFAWLVFYQIMGSIDGNFVEFRYFNETYETRAADLYFGLNYPMRP